MIKRYGLGANPEALTTNSMKPGLVQIVERKDGDYVRYEDYAATMESIGAGGVSGRVTKKTLEQHRMEFESWAKSIGINTKHKDHPNYLTQGFYRYDVSGVERMWEAWLAAKGIAE